MMIRLRQISQIEIWIKRENGIQISHKSVQTFEAVREAPISPQFPDSSYPQNPSASRYISAWYWLQQNTQITLTQVNYYK